MSAQGEVRTFGEQLHMDDLTAEDFSHLDRLRIFEDRLMRLLTVAEKLEAMKLFVIRDLIVFEIVQAMADWQLELAKSDRYRPPDELVERFAAAKLPGEGS